MAKRAYSDGTVLLWDSKCPGRVQGSAFEAVEKCEGFTMMTQHRIRAVIWDLDGVILRGTSGSDQPAQARMSGNSRHPSLNGRLIDQDLLAFIAAMRRSVHTALLVNSWMDIWEIINLQQALVPAFDRVIQTVDAVSHRPDPRFFSLAVIRLGVAPEETVLVDDDRQHIAAARQAGLQAYEFESPAQIGSQLMGMLLETIN